MKNNQSLYSFSATTIRGENITLEQFQGNLLLIVNTASKCGLTKQLIGLEKLYNKYQDQGLVILGFPCNQFLNQEPGNNKEISQGCLINYGVTFPMFQKIKVNGKETHPLFKYLKRQLPGFLISTIKRNFTKFLVNRDGKPIKRFGPITSPEKIEEYLVKNGLVK